MGSGSGRGPAAVRGSPSRPGPIDGSRGPGSSRLAHVDPLDRISSAVASRASRQANPGPSNVALAAARTSAGSVGRPPRRSRPAEARRSSSVPPASTSEAWPRATAASAPRQPRSSDAHGKRTVTCPATPRSPAGMDAAAAATKRAFGRPPLRAARAARRDASAWRPSRRPPGRGRAPLGHGTRPRAPPGRHPCQHRPSPARGRRRSWRTNRRPPRRGGVRRPW